MNVAGQFAGTSDTPLTPMGKEQASAAGKQARDAGLVFDVILASPLDRTHETARLVATEVGYPHEEIQLVDGLIERHFGALEGVYHGDFHVTREEYIADPFAVDHVEGIEKITDLQYRANQMHEYLLSLPHETILVVSHGAFGRALERAVKNMPITEFGTPLENAQLIQLI